mmetsp:Transcript_8118/g.12878  ORF Transcript_8118/g.12878 Transcript_8118/m.12878 type:complete len:84 (+) Transcript_8118:1017-1268(+)
MVQAPFRIGYDAEKHDLGAYLRPGRRRRGRRQHLAGMAGGDEEAETNSTSFNKRRTDRGCQGGQHDSPAPQIDTQHTLSAPVV